MSDLVGGAAVSSLKEQLAKLGMINENDKGEQSNAPRSWTATPTHRSKNSSSRRPAEGKAKSSSRSTHTNQRKTRRAPREEPLPYRSDLSDSERASEIQALLKRVRLPMPTHGTQRYYFELRDGTIDYIDTEQESYENLSRGQVVMTSDQQGRLLCIPRQALRELKSLDPNWIPSNKR